MDAEMDDRSIEVTAARPPLMIVLREGRVTDEMRERLPREITGCIERGTPMVVEGDFDVYQLLNVDGGRRWVKLGQSYSEPTGKPGE